VHYAAAPTNPAPSAPQTFAPQTWTPQTWTPQTWAPQTFAPQPSTPETPRLQTYGPQTATPSHPAAPAIDGVSFPDPSGITNFEALLDLAETAAAAVRDSKWISEPGDPP
jgi:hypothetical protein